MPRTEEFLVRCFVRADFEINCSLADLIPKFRDPDWGYLVRTLPDDGEEEGCRRSGERDQVELEQTTLKDIALHILDYEWAHISDTDIGWFRLHTNDTRPPLNRQLKEFLEQDQNPRPDVLKHLINRILESNDT